MEVSGQPHDPAILLPGKDTPKPFNRRLGWVSQRVWKFSGEISLGPTWNQKSFLGGTYNKPVLPRRACNKSVPRPM